MNAMTEIKHVAVAFTEACQNGFYFLLNTHRRGVQHGGIHIALNRHFIAHATTRVSNVSRPVKTECITTGRSHRFQPLPATFGEQRDRHATSFVFTDQAIDDFMHVVQGEFAVIAWRQHAAPVSKIITDCAPALIWALRYKITLSATLSSNRCMVAGSAYIIFLILVNALLLPPSTIYVASVHGLPEKPISGTSPLRFLRMVRTAFIT